MFLPKGRSTLTLLPISNLVSLCILPSERGLLRIQGITYAKSRKLSTPIETKNPLRPAAPLVDPLRESVTLRVHPQSVNVVLSHFRHQSMFQEEDGSFTMELFLPVPVGAEWLISILLELGSGVVVISPLYLQDVLKNEAKKIVNLYEDV